MKKSRKKYFLEVFPRGKDIAGGGILKSIRELGIGNVLSVKVRRVYILEIPADRHTDDKLCRIAGELLSDPVSEEYSLKRKDLPGIDVTVLFKPGVLDIEGKRILEALDIMKIKGVISARR